MQRKQYVQYAQGSSIERKKSLTFRYMFRATCAIARNERKKNKKKKDMNNESTDTTARYSVAHISWIAHAFRHRFLVLAGRVEVTDIHFQAGYFCTKKKKSRIVVLTYLHCSRNLDFFLRRMELLRKNIGKHIANGTAMIPGWTSR